jgi:hypothetical protein
VADGGAGGSAGGDAEAEKDESQKQLAGSFHKTGNEIAWPGG